MLNIQHIALKMVSNNQWCDTSRQVGYACKLSLDWRPRPRSGRTKLRKYKNGQKYENINKLQKSRNLQICFRNLDYIEHLDIGMQ